MCEVREHNHLFRGEAFKPGMCRLLVGACLSATLVCVLCVCVWMCACVSAPEAMNYIHVILNQLNKFVMFRNIMKQLYAWVYNNYPILDPRYLCKLIFGAILHL